MGFGQTVNRGGDWRGGSTLRDRFGGHGGREGERGHEREYIGGHFADDSKERRGRRRGGDCHLIDMRLPYDCHWLIAL